MKPIARVGDKHDCPLCGPNVIVSGGNTIIDGRPVARVGDKTACDAIITVGASCGLENGRPLAYVGSTTSHGGVITTGSPNHVLKP